MGLESSYPAFKVRGHEAFVELSLIQAQKSRPAVNKFRVGAVLVDADKSEVLLTGYALEYPRDYKGDSGTTHAEHLCIHEVPPANTTVHNHRACNERLRGDVTCATRIPQLNGAIRTVYVGIREPRTFIVNNDGQGRLEPDSLKVIYTIPHLQGKIMEIFIVEH
ncbi:cytidine deaminase-like protein [Xylaria sp. FL1777]|nr:cytidine deaminase-like protein [Xylaria sp. FL1777]